MDKIRVSVNEDLKIIQFWCCKEDIEKETFNNDIETLYNTYAIDGKYRKVIYRSGSKDLASLTAALLHHNIGVTAK